MQSRGAKFEFPRFYRCLLSLACAFLAGNPCLLAQGTFQNLNFESANNLPNPPPTQPAYEPILNVLPNWTVYEASGNPSQLLFNGVSLGAALVTVVGTNPSGFPPALAGNYSVTLDVGEGSTGVMPAGISQTGLVPSGSESLRFIASGDVISTSGYLTVTFNGQDLPVVLLSTGASYNLYGCDISRYAGQAGPLQFMENPGTRVDSYVYLDNIQFSAQSVPEPTTWALLLCGAGLIGATRSTISKSKV